MPGTRGCLRTRRSWLPLAAAGCILLLLLISSCHPCRESLRPVTVIPDPAWDRVFERNDGWAGADAVQTVDLEDGRILWLFGDTWIGPVVNGRHAPESVLVNNSIAWHRMSAGKTGMVPNPEDMQFLWGELTPAGIPSAWIKPAASGPADSILISHENASTDVWFWPTGDGVVVPGSRGQDRLILFLSRITRMEGDHGVWGFQGAGGTIEVIDNFRRHPSQWATRTRENPHSVGSRQADPDHGRFETTWGMALLDGRKLRPHPKPYLYIYGVVENPRDGKQMVLARSPITSPEMVETWEFFAGGDSWSPRLLDAVSVAENMVNEFSVDSVDIGGRDLLVLIHSDGGFQNRIDMRTAVHPEGPWSEPVPIFIVGEAYGCKDCFAYAAKSHVRLSMPGELLVSYVINTMDFDVLIQNSDIYRPRFVRILLNGYESSPSP